MEKLHLIFQAGQSVCPLMVLLLLLEQMVMMAMGITVVMFVFIKTSVELGSS